MLRTLRCYVLVCAFVALVSACDREAKPEFAPRLSELFGDSTAHLVRVGLGADSTESPEWFSYVFDARLTPSGSHIVVLDRSPPFIRVFDRSGRLVNSFLERGGGPTESYRPLALAVGSDSLIAVSRGGGIAWYTLDGSYVNSIPSAGPLIVSMTRGCEDDWLLYGIWRDGQSAPGGAGWLHRGRFVEGRWTIDVLHRDSVTPGRIGLGTGFLPFSGGGGIRFVFHRLAGRPRILQVECPSGLAGPHFLDALFDTFQEAMQPRSTRQGDIAGAVIRVGTPSPRGYTVMQGRLIWLEGVPLNFQTGEYETWFTVVSAEATVQLKVPGSYQIYDTLPGVGILFGTDDPVPHLLLISEHALWAALSAPR